MTEPVVLTVLGCGSSSGTPVVGCQCEVCLGNHSKNNRSRCSAWIQIGEKHLIIDTGTDFRMQALREQIPQIDAILYTHPHADHLNGIDDIRAFCYRQKNAIDIYGSSFTIENISKRFDYTLLPPNQHWNRPVLTPHVLTDSTTNICGFRVQSFELPHGHWSSTVYRIGNIAWVTDVNAICNDTVDALQNLDYIFLDCLMDKAYPSHLSVEQAFDLAKRINAKHTYLIHMTHLLEYHELSRRCPDNVSVAYDGLKVYTTTDSSFF